MRFYREHFGEKVFIRTDRQKQPFILVSVAGQFVRLMDHAKGLIVAKKNVIEMCDPDFRSQSRV